MKARNLILWLVAIIIAFVVLIWIHRKPPVSQKFAPSNPNNASVPSTASQNLAASPGSNAITVANTAPTNISPAQPLPSKEQQMRKEYSELNNEDVVLYGRVIDQFDAPVASAKVTGTIQVNNGTRVGSDKISMTTDGNGLFTISGYKGKALGVWVSKAGYVMATTNTRFVYSLLWPASERYIPDANNPTVIKMWKLQGAQPLVNINQDFKIPFTATPISFDLLKGQIVPNGGDVTITVNRPAGEISEQNPQNWNINLEVSNGGFIETSDKEAAVTFAAPESGYQSNGTFGNNNGPSLIDRAFFIESRNGQIYSKLRLLFNINKDPNGFMKISFNGVASDNGSRNWEATVPQ